MESGLTTVSFLAASILFILSLGGLSRHETARRGNLYGVLGFVTALAATLVLSPKLSGGYGLVALTLALGAAGGAVLALKVEMTAMPQLVAILHSFVGLAAVLVGISNYVGGGDGLEGSERIVHEVETFLGVFI